MKIHKNYAAWGLAGALLLVSVFALVAWTGNPQQPKAIATQTQDTVPSKQKTKVTRQPGDRDLDYELRQLDNAKEELAGVDWEKISREVENALKNIDMEKIQLQVKESMEKIDFDKIQKEVEQSLKSIDFEKIQKEVTESLHKSLSSIDKEEIEKAKKEVERELKNNKEWKKEIEEAKKINKEEIQQELKEAQKEIEKAKEELKAEKFNFKEQMRNAAVEIEEVKKDLKGYQEMIYAMEADGLLSTKGDYTIEYKNDELFINEKKQPQEVTDKYKKYFKKDKVKIKKSNGKFDFPYYRSNSNDHID